MTWYKIHQFANFLRSLQKFLANDACLSESVNGYIYTNVYDVQLSTFYSGCLRTDVFVCVQVLVSRFAF